MILVTNKTFPGLLKEIDHLRQDHNKFRKNVVHSNTYIYARYPSVTKIKPTLGRT